MFWWITFAAMGIFEVAESQYISPWNNTFIENNKAGSSIIRDF